jgi:hypothetical protein
MLPHSQILPVENALSALGVSPLTIQYRHYGLFENLSAADGAEGIDDLLSAQARFSRSITAALCQSTAAGDRVLLVGASLKAAVPELEARALKPLVIDTPSELLDTPRAHFTAMVLEGSFHYLDQLPLLKLARNYLADEGTLILFGEYLADDSAIEPAEIPNLSSLRQLSQRLGFSLKNERDCTASAIQSLKLLRQTLPTLESSEHLRAAIDTIQEEFSSGRRCFSVFEFRYSQQQITEFPDAEFLANGEFAGNEISKLFESSFGHSFDEELWCWKYLLGNGKSIAAKESEAGEIVSHYGGAPRDILFFGSLNKAIQVCDVMVVPRLRKYYGKSSLFFKSAATFLEREIGNSVGHLLGFGFPNQKAMNIAIRLGLYEKTDDFVELVIAPTKQADFPAAYLVDIDPDNEQQQIAIDGLWAEMQMECADYIIGVRDWAYVHYRYFQHPTGIRGGYRRSLLLDAATDKVLAAVVLKEHAGGTLLMDLICKPSAVALRLGQLLNNCSNSHLTGPIKLWITKGWVPRLELAGVVENSLGIEIPCNSWNPGPSAKSLYGKWWLTAGDMDFL